MRARVAVLAVVFLLRVADARAQSVAVEGCVPTWLDRDELESVVNVELAAVEGSSLEVVLRFACESEEVEVALPELGRARRVVLESEGPPALRVLALVAADLAIVEPEPESESEPGSGSGSGSEERAGALDAPVVEGGSADHAEADGDGDGESDAEGDAESDAEGDGDSEGEGDGDSEGDGDGDAESDSDGDAGGDAGGDAESDGDADADSVGEVGWPRWTLGVWASVFVEPGAAPLAGGVVRVGRRRGRIELFGGVGVRFGSAEHDLGRSSMTAFSLHGGAGLWSRGARWAIGGVVRLQASLLRAQGEAREGAVDAGTLRGAFDAALLAGVRFDIGRRIRVGLLVGPGWVPVGYQGTADGEVQVAHRRVYVDLALGLTLRIGADAPTR